MRAGSPSKIAPRQGLRLLLELFFFLSYVPLATDRAVDDHHDHDPDDREDSHCDEVCVTGVHDPSSVPKRAPCRATQHRRRRSATHEHVLGARHRRTRHRAGRMPASRCRPHARHPSAAQWHDSGWRFAWADDIRRRTRVAYRIHANPVESPRKRQILSSPAPTIGNGLGSIGEHGMGRISTAIHVIRVLDRAETLPRRQRQLAPRPFEWV